MFVGEKRQISDLYNKEPVGYVSKIDEKRALLLFYIE